MSYPAASLRETAIANWNQALQTYRMSVDLYTRVVKIRHRRENRLPHPVTAATVPVELAAPLPPILDGLTPRECEVALLIARGLSNRQIAQDLVIAKGTAANHVAHIIAKLGITNRTGIAAAVLAHANGQALRPDVEVLPSVSRSRAMPKPNSRANFVRLSDLRAVDAGRRTSAG